MAGIPEPARQNYRADIDGLRGLAVLAVVAFHAFPEAVRGGFIGVDIFFVISGFLISTIILGALAHGRFSFREFYARRIRRIFPSLVVVLCAAFAVAWFTFGGAEMKRLGLHVLGGATFSSNFMLWKESGYFDIASDQKPLLHLWSLAIEEQFYLLFPFALWAAHKLRLNPLAAISAVGFASFGLNVVTAAGHPVADFYSPATRIWELMLGAALASATLHPPAWLSRLRSQAGDVFGAACSIAGACLLLLGFVLIIAGEPFPDGWALLPTLGTALLISGGASAWINRRVLSNRALVGVGLISFPLYLWHWPLLSFARILAGGTPSWIWRSLLLAAAFLLAWMTYRFVERPLRFGTGARSATAQLPLWLASLGVIGFSAYWAGGFASRPVAHRLEGYLQSIAIETGANSCFKADPQDWFCKLGFQDAPPAAFVFGDSHAGSLLPAFAKIAHLTGTSFLYTLTKACPAISGAKDPCPTDNGKILAYVRDHHIPRVFVIFRWSNYDIPLLPGARMTQMQAWLDQTVAAYRKIGVHVYVLVDNPLQHYLPEDTLRKSLNTDKAINAHALKTAAYAEQQARLTALLSRYAGNDVTILDFRDIYCGKDVCPLVKDGKFLYGDRNHLSPDGALLVYPELRRALHAM